MLKYCPFLLCSSALILLLRITYYAGIMCSLVIVFMALFQHITLQFAHYCCLWVNSTTVLLTALHYASKSYYASMLLLRSVIIHQGLLPGPTQLLLLAVWILQVTIAGWSLGMRLGLTTSQNLINYTDDRLITHTHTSFSNQHLHVDLSMKLALGQGWV